MSFGILWIPCDLSFILISPLVLEIECFVSSHESDFTMGLGLEIGYIWHWFILCTNDYNSLEVFSGFHSLLDHSCLDPWCCVVRLINRLQSLVKDLPGMLICHILMDHWGSSDSQVFLDCGGHVHCHRYVFLSWCCLLVNVSVTFLWFKDSRVSGYWTSWHSIVQCLYDWCETNKHHTHFSILSSKPIRQNTLYFYVCYVKFHSNKKFSCCRLGKVFDLAGNTCIPHLP
jgi:hypothetical protein